MKNDTLVRNRTIEFRQLGLDHGRIDKKKGIIYDVSLITAGIEARGHDLHTDDVTLEQVCDQASEMGQVPVKWNHKTGADSVNGYVTNFRVEGNKTKADWHLLMTHPNFDQAIELAERMPGNVGLSVAFVGAPPETKNGQKFARVEELVAVDLVAQPAANPGGLFESAYAGAVDNPKWDKPMNTATNQNPNAKASANPDPNAELPTLADVLEAIKGQGETIAALQGQVKGLVDSSQADQPLSLEQLEHIAQLDDAELAKMNLTREEVDSAVADAMSGVDLDPEQIDGGDGPQLQPAGVVRAPGRDFVAGEGAGAGVRGAGAGPVSRVPGQVMAELSDLRRTVDFMVRQNKLAKQTEQAEALETFFGSLEEKFATLKTENETLLARNEALETAFKAGGGQVSTSGEFVMPAGVLADGSRAPGTMTEFEQLVEAKTTELQKDGKTSPASARRQAVQFVQGSNRDAYMKHLEAKGAQINL